VTRSNLVGCATFSLFYSAVCAHRKKLQRWLIRASKQSRGKSSPSADSLATDDIGRKLASLRTAIVSKSGRIGRSSSGTAHLSGPDDSQAHVDSLCFSPRNCELRYLLPAGLGNDQVRACFEPLVFGNCS